MTQEIIDAPVKTTVVEFKPFYDQLAELEKTNSSLVFNYADKKGDKEARSHVNKLRLTKGALERTRKEAKEESVRIGRAIDSEAAEIKDRIEAMILVHQTEIDKVEKIETDRIAALEDRLKNLGLIMPGMPSDHYQSHIHTLEQITIDESWQEFIANAAVIKDQTLAKARELLAVAEKQEADAAELERLRQEQATRAQKELDDAIAAEAVRKAQEQAKEAAEASEKKAKQAVAEAEAKAEQERKDAEARELALKLQAESAERQRLEQIQQAEKDKVAAAEKAENDRLQAIQNERDRVATQEKQEAEATRKREENKAHIRKINNAALTQMVAGGMDEDQAKMAISLIMQQKIPHIVINY